jgi:broad specificity phosphatase PhoE
MTELVLLRHGPTEWNEIGRVQGRTDIPLSDTGRARVRTWRVPRGFAQHDSVASPLMRAKETAELLGRNPLLLEPRLMEMHWGQWEGETLASLRDRYGDELVRNEARGLDFRAPEGESPRDVQARLLSWMAERAALGRATLAVAHKGILRAAYALATGWDMTGEAPDELGWDCAHVYALARDGRPHVVRLNLPLIP